jgi:hypothetical protein
VSTAHHDADHCSSYAEPRAHCARVAPPVVSPSSCVPLLSVVLCGCASSFFAGVSYVLRAVFVPLTQQQQQQQQQRAADSTG